MSTTTLRVDDTLRERIARVAQATDQTPHNFMLEALARKTDEAEWNLSMQRDAALQGGEPGVEWHEMRAYLKTRLHDKAEAESRALAQRRCPASWLHRAQVVTSTASSISCLSTQLNTPAYTSEPSCRQSISWKPAP